MSEPHSKVRRLAAAALNAAIDDKWDAASRYAQRLNDECGPDCLPEALMGWIDTLAMHATDGAPIGRVGEVRGMEYETGKLSDTVPPRIEWGQKIVKARAEMDEPAFAALINELSRIDDGKVRGEYVGAVLEAAALSIRSFPRGYARMGRDS